MKWWRGDGFWGSVTKLATGATAGQALLFAAAPLLTRLYSPEAFGEMAVFASFLGILAMVATLRYENAILLPSNDSDAASVFWLSAAVSGAAAVLTGVATLLGRHRIAEAAGAPGLSNLLLLLPLGVLAAGLYSTVANWAVRHRLFSDIAKTSLHKSLAQIAVQITFGFTSFGAFGLIAGRVVEKGAGIIPLARSTWQRSGEALSSVSISSMRGAAVAYRAFPQYSAGASLFRTVSSQLPALALASLYSVEAAGLYAITNRALAAPLGLLGNSIGHVYLGLAAELARSDRRKLYRLYTKTALRLVAIAVFPTVALMIGGDRLFGVVFGDQWASAGTMIRVLGIMYVGQFVAIPLLKTVEILERQGVRLIWEAAQAFTVVGSLLLPSILGFSVYAALGLYSFVMAIGYLAVFEINRRLILASIPR